MFKKIVLKIYNFTFSKHYLVVKYTLRQNVFIKIPLVKSYENI